MIKISGSINKDKTTGKWFFILELGKDANGKRRQKKKRGFKTKKEAHAALVELQNSINSGVFKEGSNILYKDYLVDWFKSKKNRISLQTIKLYEHHMNKYILDGLGNYQLSKLSTLVIQKYIDELSENGAGSGTIKKIYDVLSGSLQRATDLEIINKNPATKAVIPKPTQKEMTVWNESEIKCFLEVAKEDRYFQIFHIALMTGMRLGEILGLRWRDINFNKKCLTISQTLSIDGRIFLKGGKTKSSRRTIDLPDKTIELLLEHRKRQEIEKDDFGPDYQDNDLVIATQIGTALIQSNVRRSFKQLIKMADVPRIRFHDLRHTHATLLLSKGVNIKVISERLGHSNIKVTLETYSHVLPTMQEEVVSKLNDIDFDD